MAIEMLQNADSWIPLAELGKTAPTLSPYIPHKRARNISTNTMHSMQPAHLIMEITINIGIPGWQRREDALKLYELAYYVDGNILELGCFHGLSSSIMAQSINDSTRKKSITSVDIAFRSLDSSLKEPQKRRALMQYVHLNVGRCPKGMPETHCVETEIRTGVCTTIGIPMIACSVFVAFSPIC